MFSKTPARKTHRTAKFAVFALILGTFAALMVAELGLRVYEKFGYSTFVFRQYDPSLGTSLLPGSSGVHRWCWNGYVYVNQHGMRDQERSIEKPDGNFRIGIFGDSIMEAVHVQPEETSAYLLERELNRARPDRRFEVLNFSVASYSTVQEYLRYVQLGRKFDLDLILLVSIPNDLVANVEPGNVMAGSFFYAPYLQSTVGGFEIFPPRRPSRISTVTTALARRSEVALYAAKAYYKKIRPQLRKGRDETPEWASSTVYWLYDSEDLKAQEVWAALHYVLGEFSRVVVEDGAGFAVAFIAAEDLSFSSPPPEEEDVPESVVPDMMRRQFAKFATDTGTPVFNLGEVLSRYVSEKHLGPPYLSFTCDGHYNPEGHEVIADGLYRFLIENGLLDG